MLVKKELNPIVQMIPYIVNQITSSGIKHIFMEIVKGIPHNGIHVDAAVTTILLMQYHLMDGIEACKCLRPEVLVGEVQKLAIIFFE